MYSWQFSKNFPLPTYGGHFEFSNFRQKMEKYKFALTVQNRVISVKFSTHRVSKKCTKKFASIFLTVQDRVISSKFLTQPMQKGVKLK